MIAENNVIIQNRKGVIYLETIAEMRWKDAMDAYGFEGEMKEIVNRMNTNDKRRIHETKEMNM